MSERRMIAVRVAAFVPLVYLGGYCWFRASHVDEVSRDPHTHGTASVSAARSMRCLTVVHPGPDAWLCRLFAPAIALGHRCTGIGVIDVRLCD